MKIMCVRACVYEKKIVPLCAFLWLNKING